MPAVPVIQQKDSELATTGHMQVDNAALAGSYYPSSKSLVPNRTGSPVQLYTGVKNKMSDDKKMYVEGNETGNKLYADEAVIASANEALKENNSAVKLKAGDVREIKKQQLKYVQMVGKQNKTFENKGQCIDQALAVMGTTRRAAFKTDENELYPETLEHMMALQNKDDDEGNIKTMNEFTEWRRSGKAELGDVLYNTFKNLYYFAVKNVDTEESEFDGRWKNVLKELKQGATATTAGLIKELNSICNKLESGNKPPGFTKETIQSFEKFMKGEDGIKALLSRHSPPEDTEGLNKSANPGVGEAYLMISGGENKQEEKTWNFHWGAVLMKSGADTVTNESFANNDKLKGVWDMYGTKKNQSFHERHAATDTHGTSPVTLATRVEDGKLHVGNKPPEEEDPVEDEPVGETIITEKFYKELRLRLKRGAPKYLTEHEEEIRKKFKTDDDFTNNLKRNLNAVYDNTTSMRYFKELIEKVKSQD